MFVRFDVGADSENAAWLTGVITEARLLGDAGELWGQVLEQLATEDAETLLDKLPPEAQDVLRGAYHERPLLRSGGGYGEIRRVVEEWCRRS